MLIAWEKTKTYSSGFNAKRISGEEELNCSTNYNYCFTTGEINPETQLYTSSTCLHLHTWDCLQKLKLER